MSQPLKSNFVPMLPDDHGAYVMLLIPLVIGLVLDAIQGIAVDFLPTLAFPLLTLALLAAFFIHAPLEVIAKPNVNAAARQRAQTWLAIYLLILAFCGISLLEVWQRWGLLWLALPAALPLVIDHVSRRWRKQRSLGVRLPGIAGLVLSAPPPTMSLLANLSTQILLREIKETDLVTEQIAGHVASFEELGNQK